VQTVNPSQPSFYFHDYETFGTHPGRDRPAQFAGVRTDAELNLIGEPLVIYCQLAPDYLPEPEACLITGITPQKVNQLGVSESAFIQAIHREFSVPQTCILGYNNLRFDDEVTRYTLYRNLMDPYGYSWQQGNSRWDLLDLVRACYALRPDGINWVYDDEGKPSFKLERLTAANGLAHEHAHDALSDVLATIALAKLIRQAQPRLFDYLFDLRSKHKVKALIDLISMKPLVHVSGMFPATQGCVSWVAPVAWHPSNANAVIVVDLNQDISPLVELDAESICERLYTPRAELGDLPPIGIKLVHINKCPVLAPAASLSESRADELGLDRARCRQSLDTLRRHPEIREKLLAVYGMEREFSESQDVDLQLYRGFLSDADKATLALILATPPEQLGSHPYAFNDPRLPELLFRYRARNFPQTLSDEELTRWRRHCSSRLEGQADGFVLKLETLLEQHQQQPDKVGIIKALARYLSEL